MGGPRSKEGGKSTGGSRREDGTGGSQGVNGGQGWGDPGVKGGGVYGRQQKRGQVVEWG